MMQLYLAAKHASKRIGASSRTALLGVSGRTYTAQAGSSTAQAGFSRCTEHTHAARTPLRIAVGISGGVDSAVTAYLLKAKGYDVTGVYMKNWDATESNGKCTSEKDLFDARKVCETLQIPLVERNYVKEYWMLVFETFLNGYARGLTPNPDILCNQFIKFGCFLESCLKGLQVDYIATGHYARLIYPQPTQASESNCAADATLEVARGQTPLATNGRHAGSSITTELELERIEKVRREHFEKAFKATREALNLTPQEAELFEHVAQTVVRIAPTTQVLLENHPAGARPGHTPNRELDPEVAKAKLNAEALYGSVAPYTQTFFDRLVLDAYTLNPPVPSATSLGEMNTTLPVRLIAGVDPVKDQSYFLARVPSRVLASLVLPLGGLYKAQVRAIATAHGLPVAQKRDSTGLCFVSQRDRFSDFIDQYLPPSTIKPGSVITVEDFARVLGVAMGKYALPSPALIHGLRERRAMKQRKVTSPKQHIIPPALPKHPRPHLHSSFALIEHTGLPHYTEGQRLRIQRPPIVQQNSTALRSSGSANSALTNNEGLYVLRKRIFDNSLVVAPKTCPLAFRTSVLIQDVAWLAGFPPVDLPPTRIFNSSAPRKDHTEAMAKWLESYGAFTHRHYSERCPHVLLDPIPPQVFNDVARVLFPTADYLPVEDESNPGYARGWPCWVKLKSTAPMVPAWIVPELVPSRYTTPGSLSLQQLQSNAKKAPAHNTTKSNDPSRSRGPRTWKETATPEGALAPLKWLAQPGQPSSASLVIAKAAGSSNNGQHVGSLDGMAPDFVRALVRWTDYDIELTPEAQATPLPTRYKSVAPELAANYDYFSPLDDPWEKPFAKRGENDTQSDDAEQHDADDLVACLRIHFETPQSHIAAGQSIAIYRRLPYIEELPDRDSTLASGVSTVKQSLLDLGVDETEIDQVVAARSNETQLKEVLDQLRAKYIGTALDSSDSNSVPVNTGSDLDSRKYAALEALGTRHLESQRQAPNDLVECMGSGIVFY